MSVILSNYTYVDDVMRIWQGPEARPDREFIVPEEGHVNCFQVQGKQTGDLICSAILICLNTDLRPGSACRIIQLILAFNRTYG